MKKINLTTDEVRVVKEQLSGSFDRVFAPDEDKQTMMNIIDKAEALLDELDAYEEMGDDMILWYWNKYKAQQIAEGKDPELANA